MFVATTVFRKPAVAYHSAVVISCRGDGTGAGALMRARQSVTPGDPVRPTAPPLRTSRHVQRVSTGPLTTPLAIPLTRLATPRRAAPATAPYLLGLQRMAGNRATVRLTAPPHASPHASLVVQRVGATTGDLATALDDLRTTYPKARAGTHAGVTSGQADEFWQKHLAGKDLAVLVDTLLRDVLTDEERTDREVVVSLMYASGELALRVEVEGDTADARRTGVLQVFSVGADGRLQVEIRSVYAPGRGRAVLGKGVLPFLDQAGVTRIWLDASGIGGTTDGVFAWARYGFVPFPEYWEQMRVRGNQLLGGEYKNAPWRTQAAQAVGSSDPRALRNLVELSWTATDERAKEFLNRGVAGRRDLAGRVGPG